MTIINRIEKNFIPAVYIFTNIFICLLALFAVQMLLLFDNEKIIGDLIVSSSILLTIGGLILITLSYIFRRKTIILLILIICNIIFCSLGLFITNEYSNNELKRFMLLEKTGISMEENFTMHKYEFIDAVKVIELGKGPFCVQNRTQHLYADLLSKLHVVCIQSYPSGEIYFFVKKYTKFGSGYVYVPSNMPPHGFDNVKKLADHWFIVDDIYSF